MIVKKKCNNKLTDKELKKIEVEKYVETLFSRDECRSAVLNAARYLEVNGPAGMLSDSAIEVIDTLAYAFAAGELDWVKDLGREEDNDEGRV